MSARSLLRLATPADAERIAAIYAPFVTHTHVSFEEIAPDTDAMRRRLEEAAGVWPWIVCERDGNVAGFAYASAHRARAAYRWSADVSAYVDERYRRTGIARSAYRALFALLTAQGYYNVFAGITLPNEASAALHRNVGFEPIARYRNAGYKAGAWHDTEWLQLPLRPALGAPTHPHALGTLSPVLVRRLVENAGRTDPAMEAS